MLVYFFQLFFKFRYFILDYTAVGFYLRFTWTPHSNSSFLSFKVGPHPRKPRQQILILGEFYLCLCIGGLCSLGENIQYEVCPVEYSAGKLPFQVSELGRGELIVEYYYICFVFGYIRLDFLEFSASYVCP